MQLHQWTSPVPFGLAMRKLSWSGTAIAIAVFAANFAIPSAVARTACWNWEFFGGGGGCQVVCAGIISSNGGGYDYIFSGANCDSYDTRVDNKTCKQNAANGAKRPSEITSCKVGAGEYSNTCQITVCGLVRDLARKKKCRKLDTSRYTGPAPHIGPPLPGPVFRSR
jgi:hypothetical protein